MSEAFKGGVNKPVAHDSALTHVTGRSQFVGDIPLPGRCLHACLVTSPHAHARIDAIDTAAARAMPGVRAVVTAADIPGVNDNGLSMPDEGVLAEGGVGFVGHVVAAVAADTPAQAQAAAARVAVAYTPQPAVLSLRQALDDKQFLMDPLVLKRGDAAAALSRAAHRVQGSVTVGSQEHLYLETQVSIATPGDDGTMTVQCSTQNPFMAQRSVAKVLGLALNAVTVDVRRVGGGFGGKGTAAVQVAAIAALLARVSNRPVRLVLDRRTDLCITDKRHECLATYDVGFDADGRVSALDMTFAARGGHQLGMTRTVLERIIMHADNCYYAENLVIRGLACRTNTVSAGAMRAFGTVQGMAAAEAVMEHIARHLGVDPLAVRARNYYQPNDRNVTPYGQTVEHNLIGDVVETVKAMAEWPRRRADVDAFNATSPVVRKGLALVPIKYGIGMHLEHLHQASALINVFADGSVHLNHGGAEMGQGLFIKMAQIASQVLQIDLARIRPLATNTEKIPNATPTGGSISTDLIGKATENAAGIIRERLTRLLAARFKVPAHAIAFADNQVRIGNRWVGWNELISFAYHARVPLSATGYFRTPKVHFDRRTLQGRPYEYFVYGAAAAEVAVDTLTGETRVLRADIIEDAGQSLNPAIDIGQVEGGFIQGMGWMTSEEVAWGEDGRLLSDNLSRYLVPTAWDMPPVFNVKLLANRPNAEDTVFRSKGIGEPPLTLAMSVWLAIRDAVQSLAAPGHVARLDVPATPERVLAAIAEITGQTAP